MRHGRRGILGVAGATALAGRAAAQAFPERPIRIIVPSGPGGSLDILARSIAQALGETAGWQVVAENRSGGGGVIGMDAVAKARPDGHTILIASEPLTVNPSLIPNHPFDPLRDLAPLTMIAILSQVLAVSANSPHRSFADFVAAARARPNTINIGNSGSTSPGRLAAALLELAGVPVTSVAYRSGGAAATDVMAGVLDASIVTLPATLPFLQNGQMRALAVTSASRSPFRPEVPTMAETLPDVVVDSWQALFLPAGVPPAIAATLHQRVTGVIRSPAMDRFLREQAFEPAPGPPEELGGLLVREVPKWRRVVQQTGLRAD